VVLIVPDRPLPWAVEKYVAQQHGDGTEQASNNYGEKNKTGILDIKAVDTLKDHGESSKE
jgi:hypothetical protein